MDNLRSTHANQLLNIFFDLFYLHPVLTMVPEDVIRLREILDKLYPEGTPRRTESYNLLFRVGWVLGRPGDALTMSQFGEALDIPISTATRLVDWLEAGGFVERLSDTADRRVTRVALTGAGVELVGAIRGFMLERTLQVLGEFTPEETQILTLLLGKYLTTARRIL